MTGYYHEHCTIGAERSYVTLTDGVNYVVLHEIGSSQITTEVRHVSHEWILSPVPVAGAITIEQFSCVASAAPLLPARETITASIPNYRWVTGELTPAAPPAGILARVFDRYVKSLGLRSVLSAAVEHGYDHKVTRRLERQPEDRVVTVPQDVYDTFQLVMMGAPLNGNKFSQQLAAARLRLQKLLKYSYKEADALVRDCALVYSKDALEYKNLYA